MVYQIGCDCRKSKVTVIDSIKKFQDIKVFFEGQVKNGMFSETIPNHPYYVWKEKNRTIEWFATKWYKCNSCGCLWEFNYPDFPAKGFIRKFPDGNYKERGY